MNVNIVCRDIKEDRILARLAKTLAHGTGWSLSANPDKHADLNYFIIYIDYAERLTDWHATPIAAYFSHYEPDQPYKRLWWNTAAQAVDLCVITSSIADEFLVPGKPIIKVTPPIDPQFRPYERAVGNPNRRQSIGFSGFIDRNSARKGSALVSRLMHDLNSVYNIVASGAGWPCETQLYRFAELPAFYNSLDVFVCSSSIEGIPMPPLEALACGVPVVIPHNVGMLDELQVLPGLYRYPAGNYPLFKDAIQQALNTPYDPALLSESVSNFTSSQWCFDHRAGFEDVKRGQPAPPPIIIESDRHGQRGVLYVAYGTPARQCAQGAIASFKRFMPNIPVALVSDSPLGCEDVFIQHEDEDIGGRSAKTLIDKLAPKEWQYILYLDADTEIIAPIDFIYETVEDGFDLTICKNPGKYHTIRAMIRSDNKDECDFTFTQIGTDELMQLNGGVFCYQRNDRTKAFFECWHTEWKRWGKRDQAALLRSLFMHPLHMMVLGSEWNTITRYDPKERSAGVLHYPMTARRWRGVLHGRSDEPEAWRAVKQFEATL